MLTCPSCGQENPDGFRLCGMCGASLAPVAPEPREERKVVTVLFADLVGFTARAEQLDPKTCRRCCRRSTRACARSSNGTAERSRSSSATRSWRCSAHRSCTRTIPSGRCGRRSGSGDWIREEEADLQVRIAVNTGEALIRLGAQTDGEGMASGDVVNTAPACSRPHRSTGSSSARRPTARPGMRSSTARRNPSRPRARRSRCRSGRRCSRGHAWASTCSARSRLR